MTCQTLDKVTYLALAFLYLQRLLRHALIELLLAELVVGHVE